MNYTLIAGHRPENNFDGYAPHRHLELLTCTPQLYLEYILHKPTGAVFPSPSAAELIINPWRLGVIRRLYGRATGYDFGEDTSREFPGLYALSNPGTTDRSLHDGLDIPSFSGVPGAKYIKPVQSLGKNSKGFFSTADIFEVDSADLLTEGECWLMGDGGVWIRGTLRNGSSYYDAPYRAVNEALGREVKWSQSQMSAYYE